MDVPDLHFKKANYRVKVTNKQSAIQKSIATKYVKLTPLALIRVSAEPLKPCLLKKQSQERGKMQQEL